MFRFHQVGAHGDRPVAGPPGGEFFRARDRLHCRQQTMHLLGKPLLVWCIALSLASGAQSTNAVSEKATVTVSNEVDWAAFEDDFGDVGTAGRVQPVNDPLRPYNRFMFGVNDRLYRWLLRPVANGYVFVVPEAARGALRRCGDNLAFPVRFVNTVLQGKLRKAGVEIARFGINSTVGILGLFDPAYDWMSLEPSDEDFGQTLGRYGVGAGWYLVLPFYGPSNLRDAFGRLPDFYLHPISYVRPTELSVGIRLFEDENYVSLHIGEYERFKDAALDPYVFFRDAYRQSREASVKE